MSQFSVIMKRPLKSADAISAMQAVPRIFIFEQTADNTVYLWPTQRTFIPIAPHLLFVPASSSPMAAIISMYLTI